MKTTVIGPCFVQYEDGTNAIPINRARAAYLLRAARSRRSGNAVRLSLHAFRICDARLTLRTVSAEVHVKPRTPFVDVWYEDGIKLQRAIRVY